MVKKSWRAPLGRAEEEGARARGWEVWGLALLCAVTPVLGQDNDKLSLYPDPHGSGLQARRQEAGGRDEILGGLTDLKESNNSKREGADWIQLTEAEGWEPQDEVPS